MNIEYEKVAIEDLMAIAAYLTYFSQENVYGEWKGGESNEGVFQMPHLVYNEKVNTFRRLLYESGFMVSFDWSKWEEGKILTANREKLLSVDLLTLRMLITTIVRNDRFSEGAFLGTIESGLIADILQRLNVLLETDQIEQMNTDNKLPKAEQKIRTTQEPKIETYAVERTTEERTYEMKCPDRRDAEGLFEQVKDHVTTLYTRLLINGKEVKSYKSKRNALASSDFLADD